MPTKLSPAPLGSAPTARRKWTTGAVAATSATGYTEMTDWKGKTLSTGGGFDILSWAKCLDRIDISGASNSLGLGASIQGVKLEGAVPEQHLLGMAYGGQHVTEGLAGTPPLQIPTNVKVVGNKLAMHASCGVIDIGEFMSIVAVRQSDLPMTPQITMLYRSAQLSSATKKANLPLVATSGKTTYPYKLDDERTHGIRHAWVSAVQDALALGAVAFGVEVDGDGLPADKPYPLCGPASGGQLVTSHHIGIAPVVSDEWIETGVGNAELNGVAQDGTGSALSVCAVGATLGFQMAVA